MRRGECRALVRLVHVRDAKTSGDAEPSRGNAPFGDRRCAQLVSKSKSEGRLPIPMIGGRFRLARWEDLNRMRYAMLEVNSNAVRHDRELTWSKVKLSCL